MPQHNAWALYCVIVSILQYETPRYRLAPWPTIEVT